MLDTYILLKDLPGVKAGTKSEFEDNWFVFRGTKDKHLYSKNEVEAHPDWFQPEPLMFLTDDNVKIEVKDGNDFWLVSNFRITKATLQGNSKIQQLYEKRPEFRYFSTEQAAIEFVAKNKIQFTLDDLRKAFEESRKITCHKNGDTSASYADFDHYMDYLKSITP